MAKELLNHILGLTIWIESKTFTNRQLIVVINLEKNNNSVNILRV